MPKFYITYGLGTNLANNFSCMEANNYDAARLALFHHTRGKFAFMYEEGEFLPQIERFNLTEVPAQPQRFSEPE